MRKYANFFLFLFLFVFLFSCKFPATPDPDDNYPSSYTIKIAFYVRTDAVNTSQLGSRPSLYFRYVVGDNVVNNGPITLERIDEYNFKATIGINMPMNETSQYAHIVYVLDNACWNGTDGSTYRAVRITLTVEETGFEKELMRCTSFPEKGPAAQKSEFWLSRYGTLLEERVVFNKTGNLLRR